MKIGDKITVDGKVYIAVKDKFSMECEDCAFEQVTDHVYPCTDCVKFGWELMFAEYKECNGCSTPSQQKISDYCDEIKTFLIDKNKAYGDSALNPVRIFSKADSKEQLKVRIDDKLNRIINGGKYPGDNDIKDLTGYLILLSIANDNDLSNVQNS